jgi:hypothetical protein
MARATITSTSNDAITDGGSVLWSLVQGEQLEFPVVLDFLKIASVDYVYEAVVIEADNQTGDGVVPSTAKPGGKTATLTVRVATDRGTWSAGNSYNTDDMVLYNGIYYKLSYGVARVSATLPSSDSTWEVYLPNTVFIQVPSTLSTSPAWAVQPTVEDPIYGFFELSVQEPVTVSFRKTWKPLRGLIQFNYSPTYLV